MGCFHSLERRRGAHEACQDRVSITNQKATTMRATLLSCFLLVAAPALAQAPNALAATGTVEAFDAGSISVKDEAGAVQAFKLAPNLVIVRNRPATLNDIRTNDFIASAAVRKEDGKLHSTELRIFPDIMRGVGEGQRPMNDARGQTMTNATVTGTAIVGGSNTIKVRFAGGESELVVGPGVPVTTIVAADRSQVKPGDKVRVQGTKAPDGAVANRITLQ